jgi:DNA polymerase-4
MTNGGGAVSIFNQTPEDYAILFLDMDAFFAKCEQECHADLRGKPVGITPQLVGSGCIIASSYEAKKFGVKVGVTVSEAQRICPQIIIVEANPKLYTVFHKKILAVLQDISPWVSVKSIDEFSLKIPPTERDYFKVMSVGQLIKTRIKQEVGEYTTTTVGIGPNYFLAKMAAETHKPDGLYATNLERIDIDFGKLSLTDLCGIAKGLSRKLKSEGIFDTAQFLAADIKVLRHILGFAGELWWHRLRGYEVDDVQFNRSNIGHSHVLPPEWRSPAKAEHVLHRLVHKVGQRLRNEGFWAKNSYLVINYLDSGVYFDHRKTIPYCDSQTMVNLASEMYQLRDWPGKQILRLSFSVSELVEGKAYPEPLFPEMQRSLHLTRALDRINDKFGRDTIFSAVMLGAQETAPDRIAFGKPIS